MELKLAGAEIDPIFVVNTLDFFVTFYKWTKKVISVKLSSYWRKF
jgi:hypothetical protein